MAEPVVLSGSSLNTFLRCGRQWELAYVQRLKRPPSLKMARGTAGHSAAEIDMRHKLETGEDLPLDAVLDAYRDAFVEETADSPENPDKKETKPLFLETGLKGITVWREKVAPTIDPEYVEEPVQFTVNGIPYSGTLDLADKERKVRDWKFVGKKPDERSQDYVVNMVGYIIGYRQKTGMLEQGVVLDHLVLTKDPYHFPVVSEGPTPDESIFAFAGIVGSVHDSITKGAFPPTGLKSGACSWCGYKAECGYYRERR
jgi:hypothetical protein